MTAPTVARTRPLRYVEMPPAPELAGLVATYWGFTVSALPHDGFTHRVWPDGCLSLAVRTMPGAPDLAAIVGASVSAAEVPVQAGEQYWGIRFRPEAGAACCRRSATELRDRRMMAHEAFGDTVRPLIDALAPLRDADLAGEATAILDGWLQPLRPVAAAIDPVVCAAVDLIVACDGSTSIAAIAAQLGLSTRHLQRRFREATGLTPKEYAVIRRGRAALKRLVVPAEGDATATLSQVAAASGYADQSHLTRDVTRLTTFTPSLLAARLDDITHDHLVD